MDKPLFCEKIYLKRLAQKAGTFLSCCCKLGAMLAGAPPKAICSLEKFGLFLGISFQIKDDLLDFILAFENIINKPKELNVMNLVKTVNMLKERVTFPIATRELYYRFASVRYFDENESPYHYDPEYNKGKISRWMEASSEVDDFFIVERLGDMLPLPKLSKEDLPNYLETIQKVVDYQSTLIQQLNSDHQPKRDSSSAL